MRVSPCEGCLFVKVSPCERVPLRGCPLQTSLESRIVVPPPPAPEERTPLRQRLTCEGDGVGPGARVARHAGRHVHRGALVRQGLPAPGAAPAAAAATAPPAAGTPAARQVEGHLGTRAVRVFHGFHIWCCRRQQS